MSCAKKLCHTTYSNLYFPLFPIFVSQNLAFFPIHFTQLSPHNSPQSIHLYCFVCPPSPKYTNCHISAFIHPFDPISSPFLICTILASIFMCCKWLWNGSFWLNLGPSALFCVSTIPQIHKLPYLGFCSSVSPHLFTIPHLYNPCDYF